MRRPGPHIALHVYTAHRSEVPLRDGERGNGLINIGNPKPNPGVASSEAKKV